MPFTAFTVDIPPLSWKGRFDGEGSEHRRWW
ncbi:formimidoylglutamase, partial [Arthrobacter sp. Hiyo6]